MASGNGALTIMGEPSAPESGGLVSYVECENWARAFAASGMFKDVQGAAQCLVKIAAGAEIGMPPFASMNGIHIINGKVSLGAGLIASTIKRSRRYNYRVLQSDAKLCNLAFLEANRGQWEEIGTYSFSIEEAKQAELLKNPTWSKYPKAMLFNRALAGGARMHCPDVFGGPVYVPEEVGLPVDEHGNLSSVPVEPRPIRTVQAEVVKSKSAETRTAPAKELHGIFKAKANAMGYEGKVPELAGKLLGYLPERWTSAVWQEALDKTETEWRAAIAMLEPEKAAVETVVADDDDESSAFSDEDDEQPGLEYADMPAILEETPVAVPAAFK